MYSLVVKLVILTNIVMYFTNEIFAYVTFARVTFTHVNHFPISCVVPLKKKIRAQECKNSLLRGHKNLTLAKKKTNTGAFYESDDIN